MSVVFIQENGTLNQVLTYQDWRNQPLNAINFILLLNFKESFFNYLKLGGKVADFWHTCFRKTDKFIGTNEAFVKYWLVHQGLEKLFDVFKGMFSQF